MQSVSEIVSLPAVQVQPDTERGLFCPKTLPDEVCEGRLHWPVGDMRDIDPYKRGSRRCPLISYRSERQRLTAALALQKYAPHRDALREPVGEALVSETREHDLPDGALARLGELRCMGWGKGPNVLLWGQPGTGKTRIALIAYFDALWHRVSASWVTAQALVDVARASASYEEGQKAWAESVRAAWLACDLLVLDDLGACEAADADRQWAEVTRLLSQYAGQAVSTTNLAGKSDNPNVGRASDRLVATRQVKGASLRAWKVHFAGESQRRVL